MRQPLVISFLSACLTWGAVQMDCDESSACLEPLVPYDDGTVRNASFPTLDPATMSDMCSAYSGQVQPCLLSLAPECEDLERATIVVLDQRMTYMCQDSFQGYTKHVPCLLRPLVVNDLHRDCYALYEKQMELFDTPEDDFICSYVTMYLTCVHSVAERYCGEEAADWLQGYDIRTVGPTLGFIECPMLQPYNPAWQRYGESEHPGTLGLHPVTTTAAPPHRVALARMFDLGNATTEDEEGASHATTTIANLSTLGHSVENKTTHSPVVLGSPSHADSPPDTVMTFHTSDSSTLIILLICSAVVIIVIVVAVAVVCVFRHRPAPQTTNNIVNVNNNMAPVTTTATTTSDGATAHSGIPLSEYDEKSAPLPEQAHGPPVTPSAPPEEHLSDPGTSGQHVNASYGP